MRRLPTFVLSLIIGSYTSVFLLLVSSMATKALTGFDAMSEIRMRSAEGRGLNTFVVIFGSAVAVVVAGAVRWALRPHGDGSIEQEDRP